MRGPLRVLHEKRIFRGLGSKRKALERARVLVRKVDAFLLSQKSVFKIDKNFDSVKVQEIQAVCFCVLVE